MFSDCQVPRESRGLQWPANDTDAVLDKSRDRLCHNGHRRVGSHLDRVALIPEGIT